MYLKEPERMAEATSGEPAELVDAIRAARSERVTARALARLSERMEHALAAPMSSEPVAQLSAAGAAWTAQAWLVLAGAALALAYSLLAARSAKPVQAPPTRAEPVVETAPVAAGQPKPIDWQLSPLADAPCSQPLRPLSGACAALTCPPLLASDVACSSPVTAPSAARRARPAHASVRSAAAKADAPEAELELLQQAQAALRSDPTLALERSDQHLRLYPRGVFSEEREMLAIEALQKLKRKAAAWQRARAFVARYPQSPHARRVRALLDASVAPVP